MLGRNLVVWRDQQGEWRAFDDVCPHRLAPLSGDRILTNDSAFKSTCHQMQQSAAWTG